MYLLSNILCFFILVPVPKQDVEVEEKINFNVELPNFDGLSMPDSTDSQTISWLDIKGIVEDLAEILPTSTVIKINAKGRKRKHTEESSGIVFFE